MLNKKKVHEVAVNMVSNKLNGIQLEFDALQESLQSETKSSAGDKHETGRAMAQLEQEKLSRQLSETRKTLDGLKQIDPSEKFEKIGFGSLIKTDRGYFFVSVGIGQIEVTSTKVFCITAGSPLGQKILGRTSGEIIQLNGPITIHQVS